MKNFFKKYAKGLFATATIIAGASPTLTHVYDKTSEVLSVAGLDWTSVFGLVTGVSTGSLIPTAAVALVPYVVKWATSHEKDLIGVVDDEELKKRLNDLIHAKLAEIEKVKANG